LRKTLRARSSSATARCTPRSATALPARAADRWPTGRSARVLCIGQGTAAVAAQAVAALARRLCGRRLDVDPITATELSGFHLRLDMSDTLIVAVSQSGTTTDTNRTVDLARGRGRAVIGIVNRRQSDLTDKADGVLYTSDGRDVEMSVASTKAFYAQVAAGALLACALTASGWVRGPNHARDAILRGLRELPGALRAVLLLRPDIADRRPPLRSLPALLGGGRQRSEHRGGGRDPDQAQRALLQVDRLRHHRGQEAHRPLVGAAHPRLRGRPGRLHRPMTSPRRWPSSGPTRRCRS
jgi:glucosamine--fructose-6-phosphate aminotransferase (isomerizing)